MGSPCTLTSECHEVDQVSHCDFADHVCVCDEGRHPTDDRRRCVLSLPVAEIAVVCICVVLICLLVIVDAFLIVWLCRAFVCVEEGRRRPANVPELFDVIGHR